MNRRTLLLSAVRKVFGHEEAERYVRLVLAVGVHDPDYVDAYYGPAEWKAEAERQKWPLEAIRQRAVELERAIRGRDARARFLRIQARSLIARVEMLGGRKMTFDEESAALYDAVAPRHGEAHFRKLIAALDPLLPGEGAAPTRYVEFQRQFHIPRQELDAVFRAAVDEARARTRRRIRLPENESFVIEYVTGQVWSAYNWYKGGSHSLIQVNTDLPVSIDFALRLACHEGYPGHHVYNALLEDRLARGRGWIEYTVYPLYSPQSLIAEGTAEYGVGVAFPGREQLDFLREKLFPLAGLDAARAETFECVRTLAAELSYAGNEAARGYLDGRFGKEEAIRWLTSYALMSPERAAQRIRFIEKNRSYVINYNLGQDLVKRYMEKRARSSERIWKEFENLLSTPRVPSELAARS